MSPPPGRVSPARLVAYTVLRRVFEQGSYADRALRGELDRAGDAVDDRERAFAMQLAYGSVQRAGTLDHVTSRFARGGIEPAIRAALRLGAFQLLFLGGVPDHAAVDASVELAKRDAPRAAGLVNAVLRKVAGEGRAILDALDDATPAGAAAMHSVPRWLAELWFEAFGADEARALLGSVNEPAEHALRANALVTTPDGLIAALPVDAHRGSEPGEAVVVDGPFDAHASPLFATGALMPQSRASMLVAHALDPQPGERVLDLCAAPGGKTTHLAALMGDEGRVVAVERHPGRADALRATAARMRATCIEVVTADATAFVAGEPFDRVLVDPPCSGLGTLRSRPDLRWRASVSDELLAEQRAILAAATAAVRPGGRIVYSTCTLSERENEEVVAGRAATMRTTTPHRDGTDGFFIATIEA